MAKEERLAHASATIEHGHGGTRPQEQCTKGLLFALTVNPRRWARHTRNWIPIAVVTLNPKREPAVSQVLAAPLAA